MPNIAEVQLAEVAESLGCPLCPPHRMPEGNLIMRGARDICWDCLAELKQMLDERRLGYADREVAE